MQYFEKSSCYNFLKSGRLLIFLTYQSDNKKEEILEGNTICRLHGMLNKYLLNLLLNDEQNVKMGPILLLSRHSILFLAFISISLILPGTHRFLKTFL
jgi:hypothetical protein